MTSTPHSMRRTVAWIAAFGCTCMLFNGCGGGDDNGSPDFTTPLVVADSLKACSNLSGKTIDSTAIAEPTNGAIVTAAIFMTAVPDALNGAKTAIVKGLPEYCQISVDIRPVDAAAPTIKTQVNLPTTWNGKSLQMGGGGTNGVLVTGLGPVAADGPETPLPLTQGYATLGTDSGHQNAAGVNGGAFALNNEALINYAYAAYKKTRDVGVQLSLAFYGHQALRAYYIGGSEGGREAMMMAQRYPADFDGIVATDPVIRLIGLWQFQLTMGVLQSTPGSSLVGKTQLVQDTVQAACDGLDGIQDTVVSNYKACRPIADAAVAAKRCASGADEGAACFSDAQLTALRTIYTGQFLAFSLSNGLTSYPGYFYGSEGGSGGFGTWIVGTSAPTAAGTGSGLSYGIGSTFVQYFVTKNPNADPLAFLPSAYQSRILELSALMDMTSPDLGAYFARGGKLLLRENLADKGDAPQAGFDYYDSVVARIGKEAVDKSFVAFGATGLGHTSAGANAGSANAPVYGTAGHVDLTGLIDNWVVNGVKPAESIEVTNRQALPPFDIVASKPMCRYGSFPKYIGANPDAGQLAASYVCTTD